MADGINTTVKRSRNVTARPRVTTSTRLENFTNIDATDLRLGSVLVYNENTEKWKSTTELNQQNVDGGEF